MAFERLHQAKQVHVDTVLSSSSEVDYREISAAALMFPAARAGETISIYVYDHTQSDFKDTGYTMVAAAYVQIPHEIFPADKIKFVTAGTAVTVTFQGKS